MLIHAQKMKSIGTLVGGIAHDFNSILGSILLNTELALEDVSTRNTETEYSLKQVLIASKRARDLVNQMLTFSKNSEVEQKIVRISIIVKDILKMLRPMIPSTIEIKQSIGNKIGKVLANPVQIQQLVMNLCSNAAQAMKNRGTLYIKLETIKTDEMSRMSGIKTDKLVKLTVKDTGDGISKKDAERIFDPFFTTKRIGEGTGLGLSVVHGIVISHNGYITVNSKRKKGSVFEVFLPKMEEKDI
jgi:signal transduction histidine kinase